MQPIYLCAIVSKRLPRLGIYRFTNRRDNVTERRQLYASANYGSGFAESPQLCTYPFQTGPIFRVCLKPVSKMLSGRVRRSSLRVFIAD